MKAMILAAGRGERMRPLTDTIPKPLLPVGGKPLIAWHLRRLVNVGITEIVINHAWLGAQIEETLGNGQKWGVNIAYSPEGGKGLETAGGIATALPLLGDAPFLVLNGDVLTDIDLSDLPKISENLLANQQLAHLWLVKNPPHNPKGDFGLDNENNVLAHSDTAYTFSGVGLYSPELFANTPPHIPAKLAPLLCQAMQEKRVSGSLHKGLWLDVGTPERLQAADFIVKNKQK